MPKYLQIKHLWNVLFLLISAASIQIKYNPGYLCSSTLPACVRVDISNHSFLETRPPLHSLNVYVPVC